MKRKNLLLLLLLVPWATNAQNREIIEKSNCSDPESWSTHVTFTTRAQKTFVTAGFWNEPNNWSPVGVPTINDVVFIQDSAIITKSAVAYAEEIIINGGSVTITDSAQLVTNHSVQARIIKHIKGWDSTTAGGGEVGEDPEINIKTVSRFYLITDPLTTPEGGNPRVYGMITDNLGSYAEPGFGTYDLYSWDYTEELEWRNYRLQDPNSFTMINGTGYLYANVDPVDLVFIGTVRANNEIHEFELDYTSGGTYEWNGWNLIANPFMCNAYINTPYYKMNRTGGDIELANANNPILPMEGFFVQATEEGQSVTISRESSAKGGQLNMNLSSGRSTIDKAIISFGDGSKLGKFQLNANSSKVYMTQDGKDYAVLSADNQGEMPVSFKAEKDETYTLSFTTEKVSLGYLHLIDNMTGADVDLLQTPSYTFEARTTDYASRFRLVFSADSNSSESNFAFFSNGNLVISNEGNATLQVIDVMGRILNSETINGSASINVNAAAGVYMIRLINGENVKVQKVIIK